MFSIIVAFPREEDGKNIKNIIVRNGYEVEYVCTNGSQVVGIANELDGGIVICGYRFRDMQYLELNNYLPKGFEMLLVASQDKWEDCINTDIVCLGMPIKTYDLMNTIGMMSVNYNRRMKKNKKKPVSRTDEEKDVIFKAKALLMDRNNMSEEEAHRYIQKTSMDNGMKMIEMAQVILNM